MQIKRKGTHQAEVYNVLGQMVISVPNVAENAPIDVSGLSEGTYIVKAITDKGTSSAKFIKK